MASTTLNQSASASASATSINTEEIREDVVVGTIDAKDEDGKSYKKPVRFSADAVSAEDFKTKYPSFLEAFRVSTKLSKPKNYAGISEIFGDNEEEAARLVYNGAQQKVNNRMNKFLLEQDEDGKFVYVSVINGEIEDESLTWDGQLVNLDVEAVSKPRRSSLTDEDKIRKTIANLSPAAQEAVIAAYRNSKNL